MNAQSAAPDVIVIGGGVIGLSIAWELARHHLSVRVLEQGAFGQEASWAGAGILPPGNPSLARTAEARLRGGSHVLWPDWSEHLRNVTGIDNGFHRCGGIELSESPSELESSAAAWRAEGIACEFLDRENLRHTVPALNEQFPNGYLLPELGQVRNPRHLKALQQSCTSAGVDLRAGIPVFDIHCDGNRVKCVEASDGEHQAAQYVVASGAWSQSLLKRTGHNLQIEPIRGQIVLLEAKPIPFRHVIEVGPRYLVPRLDGRILIGSTEEHAGFEKKNTAAGVAGLIEFGQQLVPALRHARFERCWAGLRPHAPGDLPIIGRIPGTTNLSVAAGHFRAGLHLSPITAVLIRQLILGQPGNDWASLLVPQQ